MSDEITQPLVQQLRREGRLAAFVANALQWPDLSSEELREAGAVANAFSVLERAGAIPKRSLAVLRQEKRPWPWNEGDNDWFDELVDAARMDRMSVRLYDTEEWTRGPNA